MGFGAGLYGAWKGIEEGNKERALEDERAYDKQTRAAGLSTLDDHTAAQREQFRQAAALARAAQETLPGQTANTMRQQELDRGGIDFKLQQQPKQQQIDSAKLDRGVADIPEQEKGRVAANSEDAATRRVKALATFGRLVKSNDKQALLTHVNSVADAEALQAGTQAKKYIGIEPTSGAVDGVVQRGYDIIADDGSRLTIPATAYEQAESSLKTGKYSAIHTRDGTIGSINQETGKIDIVKQGDPNMAGGKGDPGEVTTAKWLLSSGVAKDEAAAWGMVRSSRDKSKTDWVGEMMKTSLSSGATEKDIISARTIFEKQFDAMHSGATSVVPVDEAKAERARQIIGAGGVQPAPQPVAVPPRPAPAPAPAPAAAPTPKPVAPGLNTPKPQAVSAPTQGNLPEAARIALATQAQYQRELAEMGDGKRMQWSPGVRALLEQQKREGIARATAERNQAGIEAAAKAKRSLGLL
ncbi:hypothetical protein [Herminiimonas sp. CN]|uniref:hypothetical protein n=1 Tax=Herminiimonas sp. CN TaxID=1349818 RepID=UPI0004743FD1|nr:hypothetical protein [Herminiimonas sp. CN]